MLILEKLKTDKNKLDVTDVDIVEQLKLKLKSILVYTKLFNTSIDDIQPYGSRVSGIYTDESDVDFHISYSLYFYLLLLLSTYYIPFFT